MSMPNRRCAKDVQSDFGRNLGYQNNVWDLFTSNEKRELEVKLKTMFPDLDSEKVREEISKFGSVKEKELFRRKVEKKKRKIKERRDSVLEVLWDLRKLNNGNLLMSTVFVLVTNSSKISDDDALNSTDFSCFPLFRIRKCRVEEDTSDCCMLFVDYAARVYQNWSDYIENNVLPVGKMIVPECGIYTFDDSGNVLLSVHETAALKNRYLRIGDRFSVFAAALAFFIMGILDFVLPVPAPVMTVATYISAGCAIWGSTSYFWQQNGRETHSISECFHEVRRRFPALSVLLLSLSNLIKDEETRLNLLIYGNLAMFGCIYAFWTDYLERKDDEPISCCEDVPLDACIFLFTHSVYNFQTASNIVDSTRNDTSSEYWKELSNRQRKMFDKMARETVRIRGDDEGKIDIIRGLKNIPDNKFFNDVFKVNKQLNENNVRPSFGHDGKVLLNNEISVDSATLRNNLEHGIGEPIINRAGAIPPTHTDGTPGNFFGNINANSANRILCALVNSVNACSITNVTDIQNLILNILSKFSEEILNTLIDIAKKFMSDCLPEIEGTVKRYIDFDEVLQRTFATSLQLTDGNPQIMTQHYLKTRTNDILQKVKQFFLDSNPSTTEGSNKCAKCRGYYYIRRQDDDMIIEVI